MALSFSYDVIATTGKFDPLTERDLLFLQFAKMLGDELVVILFNDFTMSDRQGYTGISEAKKIARLEAIEHVDLVILSQHGETFRLPPFTELDIDDKSIEYELTQLKPNKFVTQDKVYFGQNKESCKALGINCHFVSMGVYEYYAKHPVQI